MASRASSAASSSFFEKATTRKSDMAGILAAFGSSPDLEVELHGELAEARFHVTRIRVRFPRPCLDAVVSTPLHGDGVAPEFRGPAPASRDVDRKRVTLEDVRSAPKLPRKVPDEDVRPRWQPLGLAHDGSSKCEGVVPIPLERKPAQ